MPRVDMQMQLESMAGLGWYTVNTCVDQARSLLQFNKDGVWNLYKKVYRFCQVGSLVEGFLADVRYRDQRKHLP